MAQKENQRGKVIGVTYSKEDAAKIFSCLSLEAQDELLSVMREMVSLNKAAQVSTQTAG